MNESNLQTEREAFEAWADNGFYSGMASVSETWDSNRNMYSEFAHQMAFNAWKACAAVEKDRAERVIVPIGHLSEAAKETIVRWLSADMDVAVSNGANSVSMPDELVEIAAWIHATSQPQSVQNAGKRHACDDPLCAVCGDPWASIQT